MKRTFTALSRIMSQIRRNRPWVNKAGKGVAAAGLALGIADAVFGFWGFVPFGRSPKIVQKHPIGPQNGHQLPPNGGTGVVSSW